jgi:hypothetical protein
MPKIEKSTEKVENWPKKAFFCSNQILFAPVPDQSAAGKPDSCFAKRIPVDAGQIDVEQHQIGVGAFGYGNCPFAVGCRPS